MLCSGFCNPTDVEIFTEEKKKILLVKRHRKCADFVRAVDEIVDSYEKSKNQNQDAINSVDEGIGSVYASSEGSKGRNLMKSPRQSRNSLSVQPSQSETSYASLDRSDSCAAVETSMICMEGDDLQDVEIVSEEPTERTPLQSYVAQRRPPSVRRTRSSSRTNLSKFLKPVVPVTDVVKSASDVVSNAISDDSMTNKLIRKSPDSSISASLISKYRSEHVGSEIVATESEAVSFDEGTQDSSYKIEHSEVVADISENGVAMSGRLDLLHTNAVVRKKKRKPNRKQITEGTVTHAKLDNGTSLEVGLNKNLPKSPDIIEKSNARFYEADGDAYLPLVKRARARMCKSFPEKKQVDHFVDTKETPVTEVLINFSRTYTTSFSCDDSCPTDRISPEVKEAANSFSPSKAHTHTKETDPLILKAKKYHLRESFLDDEAALPPSKRLRRALEAMSANVSEAGCIEAPRTMEILSNGCSSSSEASTLCLAVDAKVDIHSSNYNTSCNTIPGLSLRSSPLSNETVKTNTISKSTDLVEVNSSCLRHEDCKEMSVQMENLIAKDLDWYSVNTHTVENVIKGSQPSSFHLNEKHGCIKSSNIFSKKYSPIVEERNTMNEEPSMKCPDDVFEGEDASCQADKLEGHECSHPILERPASFSKANDAGNFSPINGSGVRMLDTNGGSIASSLCKSMKTLAQSDESSKVRKM